MPQRDIMLMAERRRGARPSTGPSRWTRREQPAPALAAADGQLPPGQGRGQGPWSRRNEPAENRDVPATGGPRRSLTSVLHGGTPLVPGSCLPSWGYQSPRRVAYRFGSNRRYGPSGRADPIAQLTASLARTIIGVSVPRTVRCEIASEWPNDSSLCEDR